jgi:hypothetical protein
MMETIPDQPTKQSAAGAKAPSPALPPTGGNPPAAGGLEERSGLRAEELFSGIDFSAAQVSATAETSEAAPAIGPVAVPSRDGKAPAESARRAPGSALRAAAAVACGALVGLAGTCGINAAFPPTGGGTPQSTGQSERVSPVSPSPRAPSSASASAGAGPSPSSSAPPVAADATVQVKITPPFAVVAVDGERRPVADGAVAVSGPVGSQHDLVVTVRGVSTTARITITDRGPEPAEVVFAGAAPGGSAPPGRGRVPKNRYDIYE